MITLDDLERFGPIVAMGLAVWRGSAVVTKLQTSIDRLTDELKSHADWREATDVRLAELERIQAVETAVGDVEQRAIEARLESIRSRRGVRATEHQIIDREAIAARHKRKRHP